MSGRISEFHDRGCDVLGISTDTIETHERWLHTPPGQGGLGPIQFPLASDADGRVSQLYRVYAEREHIALRGLFIIDPNGVLQYEVVHSLSVGRSSDEVLRVLEALQIGGLCPGEREMGQPPIDVFAALGPHRVLGQYHIEIELGRGAFAKVFRAHDTMLDRRVALKVLRPREDESNESLLFEARAAAALTHSNICMVHAIDTSNGAAIIVMEYVEGQPLSRRLEDGPLPAASAAELARQIAGGMAAAHHAGVVHGDLKPANLMVTTRDEIKIMDFGLARRMNVEDRPEKTLLWTPSFSGGLAGTPRYMAPELTRGEPPGPASDVFALGLIIYEMLTGSPAISGDTIFEVLRQVEQLDASRYASQLPGLFAGMVRESLALDVEERPTMADIVAQFARGV